LSSPAPAPARPPLATATLNGNASATAARVVTVGVALAPAAAQYATALKMCVSDRGMAVGAAGGAANASLACRPGDWRSYCPSVRFAMRAPGEQGVRTVAVFLREKPGGGGVIGDDGVKLALNNASAPAAATASITYDSAAPSMRAVNFTASARPTRTGVELAFNAGGAVDGQQGSGVASFLLVAQKGSTPPQGCTTNSKKTTFFATYPAVISSSSGGGSSSSSSTSTSSMTTVAVTGLEAGAAYVFRLCAVDAAGNKAGGLTLAVSTALR